MAPVPFYLSLSFIAVTLATVLFFYFASGKNKTAAAVVLVLLVVQAMLGWSGFYFKPTVPPRFPLLIVPSILLIASVFLSKGGKTLLHALDLRVLTYLHSVRIAVEVVLFWLAGEKLLPLAMTFEGQNFDILTGLTAPVMAWLVFERKALSTRALFAWNLMGLGLLLNVVVRGILSAPSPFQQLAFDQPNVAVLYFPFVWLPSVVVSIVLFGHLAAFYRLSR